MAASGISHRTLANNTQQRYLKAQLSESTLERWRSEGMGPVFLKLRGQVRYRDTDLDRIVHRFRATWCSRRISTSSPRTR